MNEIVSTQNIQNYAQRNTSPNVPLERELVANYLISLFNSEIILKSYDELRQVMWNEEIPTVFLSYWYTCGNLNKEPYRSIIAYAMMKKDRTLFEMISSVCFTGTIEEMFNAEFQGKVVEFTDEDGTGYYEHDSPNFNHTDTQSYTDAVYGIPYIVFKNTYCNDILSEFTYRYQTQEEMFASMETFQMLISTCKPARVEVLICYEPFCFMTGSNSEAITANIIPNSDLTPLQIPFGNAAQMNILRSLSENELYSAYDFDHTKIYELKEVGGEVVVYREKPDSLIHVSFMGMKKGDGWISFSWEIRTRKQEEDDYIWGTIEVPPSSDYPQLQSLKFSPKDIIYQSSTPYYFTLLEMKFPWDYN